MIYKIIFALKIKCLYLVGSMRREIVELREL